jgi:hypothetical protein
MVGQTSCVGSPVRVETTMDLKADLLRTVTACVEGQMSIRDLFLWLASHVQAIADSHDEALQAMSGELWLLLSERDADLRDEESVREDLQQLAAEGRGSRTGSGVTSP